MRITAAATLALVLLYFVAHKMKQPSQSQMNVVVVQFDNVKTHGFILIFMGVERERVTNCFAFCLFGKSGLVGGKKRRREEE